MRQISFTAEDLQAIAHDRYHHPHPHVQRKMEVLWLKSHGLPHQQIADLAGLSRRTVQRYTLRGQDWHIFKLLELMDKQGGGVLLVIGRHLVEAIINGRLELLEA